MRPPKERIKEYFNKIITDLEKFCDGEVSDTIYYASILEAIGKWCGVELKEDNTNGGICECAYEYGLYIPYQVIMSDGHMLTVDVNTNRNEIIVTYLDKTQTLIEEFIIEYDYGELVRGTHADTKPMQEMLAYIETYITEKNQKGGENNGLETS